MHTGSSISFDKLKLLREAMHCTSCAGAEAWTMPMPSPSPSISNVDIRRKLRKEALALLAASLAREACRAYWPIRFSASLWVSCILMSRALQSLRTRRVSSSPASAMTASAAADSISNSSAVSWSSKTPIKRPHHKVLGPDPESVVSTRNFVGIMNFEY